jgi:hypothetical protein
MFPFQQKADPPEHLLFVVPLSFGQQHTHPAGQFLIIGHGRTPFLKKKTKGDGAKQRLAAIFNDFFPFCLRFNHPKFIAIRRLTLL